MAVNGVSRPVMKGPPVPVTSSDHLLKEGKKEGGVGLIHVVLLDCSRDVSGS